MAQVSIAELRHLIRTLSYVVSIHAADELEDDNLSILDLESIVLTGQIIERQRDRATREVKYVIQGTTLELHESNDPTRHSVEAWELATVGLTLAS